jgi:hypothetical protein
MLLKDVKEMLQYYKDNGVTFFAKQLPNTIGEWVYCAGK